MQYDNQKYYKSFTQISDAISCHQRQWSATIGKNDIGAADISAFRIASPILGPGNAQFF